MGAKILKFNKPSRLSGLREFAEELAEQSESINISWQDRYYADEIYFEFFDTKIAESGYSGSDRDYVLYRLGY